MAKEIYNMDGENYYLIKGKWYNSHFTAVSKSELYKLNSLMVKNISFEDKTVGELINIAQRMKDNEDLIYSRKLFEELLSKSADPTVIRSILPRYTSILRKLDQADQAINVSKDYFERFGKAVSSPALHTSLAGAYCDKGDYVEARLQANRAMAMSGGNASVELQSVYSRIKKMEKV
ncbi:MAG: hypothetical protein J5626_06735 [Lachnospiraceae bacterium]|nr:hypothetical protein [Lachnospiraceae bacterium]